MSDIQLCQGAYKEMYRAMIAKDIPILSKILDDSTGMRQSKTAFLNAVQNGTLNYASAGHESIDVTVHGEEATLIGKSKVHAAVFGGGWHTWRLEQDLTLVKKNGQWLISLSKASTY